jgi:putative glutamine amidotransferase
VAVTASRRPIIGVSCYLERAVMDVWDVPAVFLPTSYILPLQRAGATVVVLPPQETDPPSLAAVLDGVDGLYLTGGFDVDPAMYAQEPHPETDAPRTDRDAWECGLVAEAQRRDLPLLGVCRGAQILNVARGGTLVQHVPDVVGHGGYQGASGVFTTMPVSVAPGTHLSRVHPESRDVPMYHHQAIATVGQDLVVSAQGHDGVIEAIEDPHLAFCVATQWHPEQDPGAQDLYDAFVAAARRFRARSTTSAQEA